jgi:hypothetical protein
MLIRSVDSKRPNCAVTALRRRHDAVLAARELAAESGPHLSVDLSLPFLASPLHKVSADAGKGCCWSAIRYWSHHHNISLAEAGGTATGGTWTKDGERRQAEPIVEFGQVLHRHCSQKGGGFLAPGATHVPAYRDT